MEYLAMLGIFYQARLGSFDIVNLFKTDKYILVSLIKIMLL
jgi:hypothetical protein